MNRDQKLRAIMRNVAQKLEKDDPDMPARLWPHREALRLYLDTWIIAPLIAGAEAHETKEHYDLDQAFWMTRK